MTTKLLNDFGCRPLYLSNDVKGHFGDMCTKLFGVFHGIHLEGHLTQSELGTNKVEQERRGLDAYRVVNEHFAQAVSEIHEKGDLVLVYNYQLLLLPQMLRRRCSNVTCGFFFDCPFPPTEFFRTIPVRVPLLNGVLESNLILFHHFDYINNFNTTCTSLLGVDATAQYVHTTNGRLVSVMVCPLGVDPLRFDASHPSVIASSISLKERLANYRIVSAVDTLDTIKGLPQKILAFEEFLHVNNSKDVYRQKVIFVLVLTPANETGNFYESSTKKRDILIKLAKQINCLVGRVNGRYGTADYTPIHYIRYGLPMETTVALLSMTDVYLATSLSEGVAMSGLNFVAAQSFGGRSGSTNMGVLLYSEFAGCARSLKGAVVVNPYDVVAVGVAMKEALNMGTKQKLIRWLQLSHYVETYTALNWAERMIKSLALSSVTTLEFGSGKPLDLVEQNLLLNDYTSTKKRILLFSYGGVLTDPATLPTLSRPSEDTLLLLERLSCDPKNIVVVVDTSSRTTLDSWFRERFSGKRILLVAENGYCCSWLSEQEENEENEGLGGGGGGGGDDGQRDGKTKEEQDVNKGANISLETMETMETMVATLIQETAKETLETIEKEGNDMNASSTSLDTNVVVPVVPNVASDVAPDVALGVALGVVPGVALSNPVPQTVLEFPKVSSIDRTWRFCGVIDTITRWRDEIQAVLTHFKLRTPGSFVDETCDSCMIWYYTNADPAFGFRQAKRLHQHLDRMLRAWPLEAVFLRPRKCIVIRPMNSNTQRLALIALRVSASDLATVAPSISTVSVAAEDAVAEDVVVKDVAGHADATNVGGGASNKIESETTTRSNAASSTNNNALVVLDPKFPGGNIDPNSARRGMFGAGSRIIAQALQDPNCLVMCACCDAISQRMLIPLTGKRLTKLDRLSKLYTISVGIKISRATYFVEDHVTLLTMLKDVLDKTNSL